MLLHLIETKTTPRAKSRKTTNYREGKLDLLPGFLLSTTRKVVNS